METWTGGETSGWEFRDESAWMASVEKEVVGKGAEGEGARSCVGRRSMSA